MQGKHLLTKHKKNHHLMKRRWNSITKWTWPFTKYWRRYGVARYRTSFWRSCSRSINYSKDLKTWNAKNFLNYADCLFTTAVNKELSNFDKIHLALKKNNILKRAYKKIEQGSRRKKDKLLPNIRTNMFFLESMTTNLSFFFFFQRILSSLITLPTSWFCLLLWTYGE